MNELAEIIHRFRMGESKAQVVEGMGLCLNTVKKYRRLIIKNGWLDSGVPIPDQEVLGSAMATVRVREHPGSMVQPYEDVVKKLLGEGVEKATILDRLRERGFQGSYSSVLRFTGKLKPKSRGVVRVEREPGEEAQVDFGYSGIRLDPVSGRQRKSWLFVMTLSNSRHQYGCFVVDQKMETWVRCHREAFAWFGGVPRKIVIDNIKSGIIKTVLADPVLSEPYRRMAIHYGFTVSPCRPRTPEHKGKVESGVHYVKRSFLAGQEFGDILAMNERLLEWIMTKAGTRDHGTTHEAPLKRFEVEKEKLRPLPETPFELFRAHYGTVRDDCHIYVEGRAYSAPWELIGQKVEVLEGERVTEIFHQTKRITTHPTVKHRGGREIRLEHYPPEKRGYLENTPAVCQKRAMAVGPNCEMVITRLLSDEVVDRLKGAQLILSLGEKHGRTDLELACRRAIFYDQVSYLKVKAIIRSGLARAPLEEESQPIERAIRYCHARTAAEFFGGDDK